jgi:hypothetical protein
MFVLAGELRNLDHRREPRRWRTMSRIRGTSGKPSDYDFVPGARQEKL